jgi:thiol-disulfide isomerase/thioredoxin
VKRREFSLLGLASVLPALTQAQSAEPGTPIDWPVISVLGGDKLDPASWRGKPAIVVFWATYCPYCKRHNAHIEKLYRATQGQSLRVLGVALDTDEGAVRRYMAVNGYSFPVALDGGVLRQRLTPRRVIPMTCVLDRLGRVVQAIPGEMAEDDVLGFARLSQRPDV